MKILELRIENYKRFQNEKFELDRDIILLYGENSSGKSSLLKAIGGAKQTFGPENAYDTWAAQGEIADLGDYSDFIHNHNTNLKFKIGLSIPNPSTPYFLFLQEEFDGFSIDFTYDHNKTVESAKLYSIEVSAFKTKENQTTEHTQLFMAERHKTQPSFSLRCSDEGARLINETSKKYKFLGSDTNPKTFSQATSIQIKNAFDMSLAATKQGEALNLNANGIKLEIFNRYVQILKREFKRIHYLGPLRMSPSRGYKKKLHELSVGTNGEQTPTILYYMQQAHERSNGKTKKEEGYNQWERFSRWFSLIFKERAIKCEKSGSTIKVGLCRDGRTDSIQDIGFGYSQIIPIIAQSAVMAPGETLIIEQPELHLHPKAQVELAKFIVEAKRYGIRFLIETHSEHILKGLQLAISENNKRKNPHIKNTDIGIIYFSDSESASYKKLELDEWGEIIGGWPKGFFDESLELTKKIFINKNF